MNIKTLLYVGAVAGMALTTGCKDWLDINHSPNSVESVDYTSMFPGAEVNIAYTLMAWDNLYISGIYDQYLTQRYGASQFKTVEQYTAQDYSSSWINFYTYALPDLKAIKDDLPKSSSYSMACEILQIYVQECIADIWGDTPYSEIGDKSNLTPAPDTQEDIYADLLSRIDAVIDNYSNGYYHDDINSDYDFLLDGSVEEWARFAYSLKLKLNLRLSNVNDLGMTNAELLSFVEANKDMFIDNDVEVKASIWGDKSSKYYPNDEYDATSSFTTLNIVASRTITAYMADDPRLHKMFGEAKNGGWNGMLQGDYNYVDGATSENKNSSDYYCTIDSKTLVKNIPLMSLAENYFNMSEVYLVNGDDASAQECYEKAIESSNSYWGVEESDILDGYASWTSATDKYELLNLQRWASFCMSQHLEAFLNRNRTGYPTLSDVTDRAQLDESTFPKGHFILTKCGTTLQEGVLPASMLYPSSETALNPNLDAIQKSDMTTKLFWHKK